MADKLRIKKVEHVQVLAAGEITSATLHLMAHHLVLVITIPPRLPKDLTAPPTEKRAPKESWIAYPMIAFCAFRPTAPGSGLASSIRIRGRDFSFITLNFADDKQARDVFESIKNATCKLGSIEKLHAFSYDPVPPEKKINGWELYDAKAEWKRQGISDKGVDRGWRISKINTDYVFSPTYPALLPVPSTISDNTLNYAGRYRSRVRIPVLTYLHPVNNCSISRSSQPLAGLRGNRSIQDEKLVSACFSACAQPDEVETPPASVSRASPASSQADFGSSSTDGEISETERLEDEIISSSNIQISGDKPLIYGAQQHNLIVDARPTVNALAMQAVGLGSENMDHYKFAAKVYLGIDNIHVMRNSLDKVIEAIKDSDISKLPPNRDLLAKSGWLKHITGLLDGSALIARQVGIQHSHVLIHCSDGWDRTSQLSALSQIMLDPYYRTIDGFIVLVEKDWLAFGHMFQHRSGFLNSEKWFQTQNDALAGSAIQPNGGEGRGNDSIENALLSAKRFFNKSNQDATTDSDGELISVDDLPKSKKGSGKDSLADKEATKPKETSPVFHQFLDATYQLLYQHPTRFEFNERFLKRLLYHLYSCQYGTFLYNNEKSRVDARVQDRTASVWSYFLSKREEFTNKAYDGGEVDDHVKGKERLLFPKLEKIRWWHSVFNRTDLDMNGPSNAATDRYLGGQDTVGVGRGVLTGVETAHAATVTAESLKPAVNGTPAPGSFASLREGIAGLGIGMGKGGGAGAKSPANSKQPMEVEMQ
ncbi:protein phosphatase [Drepanopeziza brunnea f. sp. 'multigermtubi' MB_m1]|uniref:Protein phosphatase n=1 Tax=Marssonina brunnea f. sp. multigermtubi (strain MB_m1) TaxID=1072389 RepID=K1Y4Z5_MARBU|nr:protein phosphatase [Drepanopeziza brunnea f. sp. 'multigermtubi' MB_m1]EKD20199.1 protein phosphatase [Drepanopeziza brunnea f. sp. 'multigermtubi' MB_m1]